MTRYDAIMANQPMWQTVDAVKALRVGSRDFVAVPVSGRKNSKLFDIVNLKQRGLFCQLTRAEAIGWLVREATGDFA